MIRPLRLALLLLAATAAASPAAAQQRGGGIRFEDQKIIGVIQKPEIQILITKQNLTPKYELQLEESFLPKVVDSVEHKPF